MEADSQAFDVGDCFEEVFGKGGEHVRNDSEGNYVAVDQVVAFLPVGAAH